MCTNYYYTIISKGVLSMKINTKALKLAMLKSHITSGKGLAIAAGISPNTVSRMINGLPITVETLLKLTVALEVEPADLVEG